jgi:hypothetical protein
MNRSKIPSTAELRDDEGHVCAVWSEGASFALIGRRHNGRLYVGHWVSGKDKKAPSLQDLKASLATAASQGFRTELVTGTEADELIAAIEKQQRAVRPVFAFRRDRQIEIRSNFTLAGQLFIPKKKMKKNSGQELVSNITNFLIEHFKDNIHSNEAFGWPNGRKPYCADETLDDEKIMHAWLDRCVSIAVRVDPSSDAEMRMVSEMRRTLGIAPDGSPLN